MSAHQSAHFSRAEHEFGTWYLIFRSAVASLSWSGAVPHRHESPALVAVSARSSKDVTGVGFTAETKKRKSLKSIPFLQEQQELSAMFEPEKVAHYFQNDQQES